MGSAGASEHIALQRRVAVLEAQLAELAKFTGIDVTRLPSQVDVLSAQCKQLALQGQTIHAIKLHREQTGADLLTAKTDVEDFLRRARPTR